MTITTPRFESPSLEGGCRLLGTDVSLKCASPYGRVDDVQVGCVLHTREAPDLFRTAWVLRSVRGRTCRMGDAGR